MRQRGGGAVRQAMVRVPRGEGGGVVEAAARYNICGAASLALPSLVVPDACDRQGDGVLCFSTGEWALVGVAIGAPLGAASGAVAGFVFPRERWRSVTVRSAPALTLQPQAEGVQVGLSLRTP
ncbi:MAG: hypothetical protein KY467_02600 [Gemmatimonadetes bacterium]|nr:hypothetical protein [Gemmatimonadota bacterium]